METDESQVGAEQGRTTNNVVPLPRDWLGPREELVPFGPSARRSDESWEGDDRDSRLADAQAFWTEDAAAIHQTLEAPQGAERMGDGGRAAALSRFAAARAVAARAVVGLHRAPVVALALGAVAAVVAILVRGLDGGHQPSPSPALTPTLLTQVFSPPAVQLRVNRPAPARHPPPRGGALSRSHHVPATTVVAQTASAYPTPTSASTSSVASVRTSSASSTSSPTSYYQSHPVVAAHSAPVPSQSSGAPAGASPASSQSTPAFGAAGALGPGSSPNS